MIIVYGCMRWKSACRAAGRQSVSTCPNGEIIDASGQLLAELHSFSRYSRTGGPHKVESLPKDTAGHTAQQGEHMARHPRTIAGSWSSTITLDVTTSTMCHK